MLQIWTKVKKLLAKIYRNTPASVGYIRPCCGCGELSIGNFSRFDCTDYIVFDTLGPYCYDCLCQVRQHNQQWAGRIDGRHQQIPDKSKFTKELERNKRYYELMNQ